MNTSTEEESARFHILPLHKYKVKERRPRDDGDKIAPANTNPTYCCISLQPLRLVSTSPKTFNITKVYIFQLLVEQNC